MRRSVRNRSRQTALDPGARHPQLACVQRTGVGRGHDDRRRNDTLRQGRVHVGICGEGKVRIPLCRPQNRAFPPQE